MSQEKKRIAQFLKSWQSHLSSNYPNIVLIMLLHALFCPLLILPFDNFNFFGGKHCICRMVQY